MSQNKPITKGYIYSICDGLYRYEGVHWFANAKADELFCGHWFTALKVASNPTKDLKDWNEYKIFQDGYNGRIRIVFTRKIFKHTTYQPTLTVLYANR